MAQKKMGANSGLFRKAASVLLSGALVCAFAPTMAFAHYEYNNKAGETKAIIGTSDPLNGGVKLVKRSGNTVQYMGYAHSDDGNHYTGYSLYTELTTNDDGIMLAPAGEVPTVSKVYGDADGLVDPDVVYKASENAIYLNWAIDGKFGGTGYRMKSVVKQIQTKLDAGSAVSGISTVSGATRSSKAIIEAYKMAAANAEAGVGKTPQEAVEAAAE